ncbi:NAD(P)/FAD-dependent oxidoreductase [uncultured Halopseudomonas sp.]|uniref:flavin-containing monooxygenase n=1 Tax=uncultured Halopseudomonas sp. TaxID=2901193 RepID=UPI0030EB8F75|tara:strand:- start:65184 stop:66674 length:1491 start_codon:yes stop_codon:yes gene_type:complete
MAAEHLDVIIVGAGLSGIGMACHLTHTCPDKRFVVLEKRAAIGGTWDLFRYPGIRSDSDMFTFGYKFRPWNELQVLAGGDSIREYIRETAEEFHITDKIHFNTATEHADWSSEDQQWTVTTTDATTGEQKIYTCNFLVGCTGYYNYEAGYLPEFPGVDTFKGTCIHPQHWPTDLDYAGKKVVVIGSGATAVTLVPAMADTAEHVTMLQRSPSYVFSVPGHDKISEVLGKFLPQKWVYNMARKRNIVMQRWIYKAAKRWPDKTRQVLLKGVSKKLDDQSNMKHFTPSYNPWDERLCAVPDADLFEAINKGKASVVTDHIDTFTEKGIRLKSGQELEADIIITATGLQMQMLGGMQISLDGEPCPLNEQMTYKAVMMQNVPNLAWILGYTNAPWTLKADMASLYICRLLAHMEETGKQVAVPLDKHGQIEKDSIMGSLQSGYVQRANGILPRQGRALPWRILNNYELDSVLLLKESLDDGVLTFDPPITTKRAANQAA